MKLKRHYLRLLMSEIKNRPAFWKLARQDNDPFCLQFEGVSPPIEILMQDQQFIVSIYHFYADSQSEECLDLLVDWDLYAKFKLFRGWYCKECLQQTYYRSLDQLVLEHSVRPFIRWADEHIKPGNQIVTVQSERGGATSGKIYLPGEQIEVPEGWEVLEAVTIGGPKPTSDN